MASHTRAGVSGMSMCAMPNGWSASITALAIAAGDAIAPASPTPFTPSGLTGDGVTVRSVSNIGSMSAFGIAQALWEEARYDASGQLLTGSLMDYAMPCAMPP